MKKDLAYYRNDYPLLQRSKPLSPKAATLEALVISKIKPNSDGKPSQVLLDKDTLSKYGICDVDNAHFMRDLEILKTQLITYEIELPYNSAYKIRWRTLVSQFDVMATDDIRIGIDPDLTPYLVELQKNFTICDVVEVATLSNQYSKKLYMLLKTIEYKGAGRFTFDEIKDSLGISTVKTYRTFENFNKKIFKSSLKEINTNSDILVDWSPVRASRRIIAVDFKVKKNPKHQPKLPIVEEITDEIPHEIRVFLDVYGFNNDSFIEALLERHGSDLLLEAIKLFDKRNSNTSINNKAGLLNDRIGRYIGEAMQDRKRKSELEAVIKDKEMIQKVLDEEKAKRELQAKEYAKSHKRELYDRLDDVSKSMFSFEKCPMGVLEGLALDELNKPTG